MRTCELVCLFILYMCDCACVLCVFLSCVYVNVTERPNYLNHVSRLASYERGVSRSSNNAVAKNASGADVYIGVDNAVFKHLNKTTKQCDYACEQKYNAHKSHAQARPKYQVV